MYSLSKRESIFSFTDMKTMRHILHSSILSVLLLSTLATADIHLQPIGTYASGRFDQGAAEISAYDPHSQQLFVTNAQSNSIDILDISTPTTPSLVSSIDLSSYGGGVNSAAFGHDLLAVAVEATVAQKPGKVVLFDADGHFLHSFSVGALPDMLTFTPDGTKILVANEGEPNSYGQADSVDPEGSVSIIDLAAMNVTTVGFDDVPLIGPVRIFGPDATVAQDLEPEYITVAEDSTKAWVSLQENNALGILDLTKNQFTQIVGFGFKYHSLPKSGLDVSDRDQAINIAQQLVIGMYQPDAIAAYTVNGQTFVVTANEGDARDYDGFVEETRVEDVRLDPRFPQPIREALGRLMITNTLGDPDRDGDFDQLYAFGGRSFSIFDGQGTLVFDSGDDFEQITAQRSRFNSDHTENTFDTRSDNRGPEPEGLVLGQIGDRTYAFIGLERIGGVITYDITDPFSPVFVDYVNNRNFSGSPKAGTAGDLGPEGLLFISAQDSPNQIPLLVVTNEVSGTTTLFTINSPEN